MTLSNETKNELAAYRICCLICSCQVKDRTYF